VAPAPPSAAKININTSTAQELTALPGIGIVRAKKAVDIRTARGGFTSFDDFARALELEPHFAVQIEQMITVSAPPPLDPLPATAHTKGRTVDVGQGKTATNSTEKSRKVDI
jgi:hypothetical protein